MTQPKIYFPTDSYIHIFHLGNFIVEIFPVEEIVIYIWGLVHDHILDKTLYMCYIQTQQVTERQSWQIIGLLKYKKKSQQEIADLVGVSRKCVFTTKYNYEKTSVAKKLPKSGRPRKLTSRDESYIFRKPLLTALYQFKKAQMTGRKVIFSDEFNFEVFNRKSRVFIKRFANEKYHSKFCLPKLQNGGGSVGCINHRGTGCCSIYTGRINQFVYMDTLENQLLPSVEIFFDQSQHWIFQQNEAKHDRNVSLSPHGIPATNPT
ncbi:transposable element Tcb1 transposase [Brachionus plicatilis]|uniref:Transposable element Tcb1 transposase n=1 Tax=Brachionus plicatilis TaxID=10195 RepID=A0A3M7Q595_BRAPC|nr:transposable element Tcb1 transposase [Brachionus plicatilis]